MELCNLTTHNVTIVDEDGKLVIDYPSRGVAKCRTELQEKGRIDSVPILRKKYTPILGLPKQSVDCEIIYIVDAEVAEAVRDTRLDIVTPTDPDKVSNYPYAYRSLTAV